MERRHFLKLSLAAPLVVSGCHGSKPDSPVPPVPADMDITAEWKDLYANVRAQPGTSYRAGHVKASEVKLAPEKTSTGYLVRMPGAHPIPTPAVYKRRVFVSGGFGSKQYFCLDAASGQPVWGVDLDDDGPSTAAIEDDLVVVNTESCTIFTMEAETGRMAWSYWLGDPLMSAPTIANGRVFASFPANGTAHHKEASHILGCFDLRTGRILWQRWIDGDVISAPVASGDEIVAATFGGTVFRFGQASGDVLSVLRARATSAPVVVGHEMHFSRRAETSGGAQEALCAWDNGKGRMDRQYQAKDARYLDGRVQRFSGYKSAGDSLDAGNGFSGGAPQTAKAQAAESNMGQSNVATLQGFQGSRILRYGQRHVSCMGDEVVCNDARDGKKLWSVPLKGDLAKQGGALGTPPVAAGKSLFFSTLDGDVVQIDGRSGERQRAWNLAHPVRYSPVVEGGRVFVGTQDSLLVCVDTGDASLGGWPQWGRNAQRTGVWNE